jgi:1-acyl-sn-glycerol-3-phosphate acyltransferase
MESGPGQDGVATWLRSAAFNLSFYVLTAIMAVLAVPLLMAPRRWLAWKLRLWARLVLGMLRLLCGIRLRVIGSGFLPKRGQAGLVAAKHQSAFDTIVWFALLPDAIYVLKQELLRIPLYGHVARHVGMIAVDRSAGASALRHLLRAGMEAAARKRQIVIFPEGTRVAPGTRVAYQPGVAALAASTGLPVIPAATDSGLLWARRAFLKRPGVITLEILPPLPQGLPRSVLMARLETLIETASARLLEAARRQQGPAEGETSHPLPAGDSR